MNARTPLLSIKFLDRQINLKGKPLRLTKRFFNLYCYLAAMRIEDPAANGGFVDCEQIRRLPDWTRNDRLSAGKQISRHVLRMKALGKNMIEAEQRVGGPFRLRVIPSRIRLDVPAPLIFKHFALPGFASKRAVEWVPGAARVFTEQY